MKKILSILAAVAWIQGCSQPTQTSLPHVSNIDTTSIRKQGTDNCWVYASTAWVETLHLKATGKSVDLSESYWTYWYLFELIKNQNTPTPINPEGSFAEFTKLVEKYGYLVENDFVGKQLQVDHNSIQQEAVDAINTALSPGGALSSPGADDAKIMKELDAAFGVKMATIRKRAKAASDLVVGKDGSTFITLEAMLTDRRYRWTDVSFPGVSEATVNVNYILQKQDELLKRIMKALNDHQPVLIAFTLVRAGLDAETSTFKGELVAAAPGPVTGGGHMVIAVDYAVDDAPKFGSIEEGEASPQEKAAAIGGTLLHLKVKNSWGLSTKDPESQGFYRLDRAYLTDSYRYRSSHGKPELSNLIRSVLLPPGY